MQETRQLEIKLNDISSNGLKIIIDFIYSGDLKLNIENLNDLLNVITHLQVKDAFKLCEEYLYEILNINNCIDLFNLVDLFSLQNVKLFIFNYILKNFHKLNEQNQIKFSYEQLIEILKSNKLKLYPEIKIFNLICKWLSSNINERFKYSASLYQLIRYQTMKAEEFIDHVSKNEFILKLNSTNHQIQRLLVETYEYFALPNRQYSSSSIYSQIRNQPLLVCVNESMYILNKNEDLWQYLCYSNATCKTLSQKFVVVNNYLYACGGYHELNRETTSKCFRFDPRNARWHPIESMLNKRQFFTLTSNSKYIVAIGGVYGDKGNFYATFPCKYPIEIYSIESNYWKYLKFNNHESIPILKWTGACLIDDFDYDFNSQNSLKLSNCKLFVVGGKLTDGPTHSLCDNSYLIHLNDDFTTNSVEIYPSSITKRFNQNLFYLKNTKKIILFGGEDDKYRLAPCIEIFNLETCQWTEIATIPISMIYQCISTTLLIDNKKIFFLLEEHAPSSESYILKSSYFHIDKNEFEEYTKLPHPSTLASKWCMLVFPQELLDQVIIQSSTHSLSRGGGGSTSSANCGVFDLQASIYEQYLFHQQQKQQLQLPTTSSSTSTVGTNEPTSRSCETLSNNQMSDEEEDDDSDGEDSDL
jgi:hypothetical protein